MMTDSEYPRSSGHDSSNDPLERITNPASRASDPGTSREAEEAINASGQRVAAARATFLLFGLCGEGLTSREFARVVDVNRHSVAKRLPELTPYVEKAPDGYQRTCRVSGRKATVWMMADEGWARWNELTDGDLSQESIEVLRAKLQG